MSKMLPIGLILLLFSCDVLPPLQTEKGVVFSKQHYKGRTYERFGAKPKESKFTDFKEARWVVVIKGSDNTFTINDIAVYNTFNVNDKVRVSYCKETMEVFSVYRDE